MSDVNLVEEFHIGGRAATESFLDQLDLSSDHHVRQSLYAVASPDEYKNALRAVGFQITAERNRRDFALDFFARL